MEERVEDSLENPSAITVQIRAKMTRNVRDADHAVGLVSLSELHL